MGYTKLNIHIYSPTSYAYFFFFFLLIRERLQKISSWGLAFTQKHGDYIKMCCKAWCPLVALAINKLV